MKRTFSVLICLFALTLFYILPCSAREVESLSAECAVLYAPEGQRVLYGKNEEKRHAMASTTKIMTALVALRHLPLDTVVTIPAEATGVEGSSVYLKPGETYTLEALLYALLLQSANDAAEAIAYAVAGGIEQFAALMNDTALELGLSNTHFENPHGLDGEAHYTTARELAVIAAEALENEDFAKIVSTRRYIFTATNGENQRTLINHNKMLVLYDGAVGVKTGYTKSCGRCLVTAARRDGLLLVSVTLDAPGDWADHTALLDYGFSEYENRIIASERGLSLSFPLFNTEGPVTLTNSEALSLVMKRGGALPSPTIDIIAPPTAPIEAGTVVGSITYRAEDGTVAVSPLIVSEDIPPPKNSKGWFGRRR